MQAGSRSIPISESTARILIDYGIDAGLSAEILGGILHKILEDHGYRLDKRIRELFGLHLRQSKMAALQKAPEVYQAYQRALEDVRKAEKILSERRDALLGQALAAVREAEKALSERRDALMSWVAKGLGLPSETTLVEGVHDCLKSPIGVCVYDEDNDPCHDDCLFCGDPSERK